MPYGLQASNYAAGDYYNAYAAGGIFGSLAKLGGKLLGGAAKILPGPLGTVAGVASKVLTPSKSTAVIPAPNISPVLSMIPNLPVPRGTPGAVPVPGVRGTVQRILPGGASGFQAGPGGVPGMPGYHLDKKTGTYWVKNRSMNPGNARALRRAIRREQAFVGLAKRALRGTGYTFKRTGAPKTRKRRR